MPAARLDPSPGRSSTKLQARRSSISISDQQQQQQQQQQQPWKSEVVVLFSAAGVVPLLSFCSPNGSCSLPLVNLAQKSEAGYTQTSSPHCSPSEAETSEARDRLSLQTFPAKKQENTREAYAGGGPRAGTKHVEDLLCGFSDSGFKVLVSAGGS